MAQHGGQEGDASAVIVMVSNINGTDVGIVAERYRGALGHLYSPGAQRGPWPEIPYALRKGTPMSKLRDNQALCDEIRASCSILKPGATVPIDRAVTRILDAVDRHLVAILPGHLQGEARPRCAAPLGDDDAIGPRGPGYCDVYEGAEGGRCMGSCAVAPASAPTVPDLVQTACGPVHRDNIGRPPSIPAPTAATSCEPAQLICGHCGEASIDHMGAGNDCAGGETTFETATDFNQALRRASATADISEGGVGPLRRVAGAGELSTSFEYRPLGKRVWQPVEPSCSGTGRSPGRAR